VRGRVLIIDDEPVFCRMLEDALSRRGFELRTRNSMEEASSDLRDLDLEVLVADLNLRGESGLDLCARVVADRPDLPVIIITAFGSLEAAIGAIRAGAYDFLTKPFEMDVLEVALDRAVGHHRLREEVRRLRQVVASPPRYDEMLGASEPMAELFSLLDRVAECDASVLITGESGTGKECVARAIHRQGSRRDGPFIAINCAAVPESLLESELFGHAKGAYTDARSEHTGLFVQANGGTLFLDEIGELPLAMQPKLLRALQERTVRPLGSPEETPFDARLIASTNRDLEEQVRCGQFREDLFYRVQVIHLEAPPLRSRGNDVLLLADHFARTIASRTGRPALGLSGRAAVKLRDYPWPGNVRELQNCMERAVALAEHDEIRPEDLPERVRTYRPPQPTTPCGNASSLRPLDHVERDHILGVLEAVSGNKSQAARILGLDRKTLYRKLEGYGVMLGSEEQV
jgi:two-component system, NtrC family, response regulator AtoC